ncbi:MAG: amidohydrolase family protein [Thermoplasmatales archaeon]
MDILIKGGVLITEDHKPRVKDLLINGNTISQISDKINTEADYVIDCTKSIVSPGFVNMHTHIAMTNMRPLFDDLPFKDFLDKGFKLDSVRTPEEIYYGSKLGIAEMLSRGITAFVDMYYGEDMVAKASEEMGIRAYLGWSIVNKNLTTQKGNPLSNAENFIREHLRKGIITPFPAPHGIYTCERDDLIASRELAERYDVPYSIHLSETRREVYDLVKKEKKRPVEYLQDIGFLGNKLIAAHAVYLTLNEIKILGRNGVTVVNNPVSNMKLGNGNFMPIIEMVQNNVNVTIGTDSATTGNSLDMLENAKLSSLIQKNYREQAEVLPPWQVIDFMTRNPWRVLGNGGVLKEGYPADITVIRNKIGHAPFDPEFAEHILIYSSNGRDVTHTIVNGELLYSEGKFIKTDLQDIIERNEKILARYRELIS